MEVKEDVFEHTAHCPKVGGAGTVFVTDAEPTLPPPLIWVEIFITVVVLQKKNHHLLDTVHFSGSKVTIRLPPQEEGRVASHQGERQPLEELPCGHFLITSLVSSYSCPNFLHLLHSHFVESSQGFKGNGEEHKSLLLAGRSSPLHLAVESLCKCAACLCYVVF